MILTDARGVTIEPGDTVLWGYPYDSSIAMAEGVVLGAEPCDGECDTPTRHQTVSLTPSGRVRIRVVRRNSRYGPSDKPVVDVAPNRLVVLKACCGGTNIRLPLSPLPTQEDDHA